LSRGSLEVGSVPGKLGKLVARRLPCRECRGK